MPATLQGRPRFLPMKNGPRARSALGKTGLIDFYRSPRFVKTTIQQAVGGTLNFVGEPAMPSQNLVSSWRLDELSGTRVDSFGANHLTDNNSTGAAAGFNGNAASFVRANSNYLSCASNASLQMSGNTDFTIVARVKLRTIPGSGVGYSLITKDDDAANSRDYTLDYFTGTPGGFRFYIQGAATYLAVTNVIATVGQWYFLVAWYDSSNGQLHLQINNAATYDSVTGATGTDVSAAQFRIGAREYAGVEDYADADIDAVRLYKRLLTDAEKTALRDEGVEQVFGGLPARRTSPIITLPASSWYESQVYDFNVMVDPADSTKLKMYASGMAAPVQTGLESIGLFTANASDPYTWADQGQVLQVNPSGWENNGHGLRVGSIFYDSGTYYLYYGNDTVGSIGIATSTDGTNFTKYAGNPILTPTGQGRNDGDHVSQPAVIKEGSSWTMIYSYRDGATQLPGFRYATSSDGLAWTKGGSGDILTVAPLQGEYHQILKLNGRYYLIYEAGTGTTPYRILVADSASVTGPYDRVRTLLSESTGSGNFDQYHVATPFMFNNAGTWILYYAGAGEHAIPFGTNHWPGGAAPIQASGLTKLVLKSVTAAISFAGGLTKQAAKSIAAALSFSGAVTKRANKSTGGTLSFSGALSALATVLKNLSGTLSFSGGLTKRANKSTGGTLSFSGAIARVVQKATSGVLNFTGALSKRANKTVTGTLSFSGALSTVVAIIKNLSGTLGFSGSVSRQMNKSIGGTLSFTGGLAKRANKAINGTLSFSGGLTKLVSKSVGGVLSFIGSVISAIGGEQAIFAIQKLGARLKRTIFGSSLNVNKRGSNLDVEKKE